MLPADAYNLVPPPEVTFCQVCGARYLEDLQFIGFDVRDVGEDGVSGVVNTRESGAGFDAYKVRDGGGTHTIVVRRLQLCSGCLKYSAELLGFGDTRPLHAEIDELNKQLLALRQDFEQSEQQRIEAESALRDTAVYQRLLAIGELQARVEQLEAGTEKRSQGKRPRAKEG